MALREREPPANGKYLPGGDLLHSDEAPPEMGIDVDDLPNEVETDIAGEPKGSGGVDWLQRAQDAYYFSTSYLDANYRKKWEDSIRAFNNQHALDSKYNHPAYAKRSNLFRPKTRSIIRKNEAAAYAVFFSNPESISAEAENKGDQKQEASAEVTKHLLEYRLQKSIPWFHIVLGGLQDAQTTGVVIAKTEWIFEQDGERIKTDKPSAALLPSENFRFDPAASWIDPVNTSPYLIELIPMFVGEVKEKMRMQDPKTGQPQWKSYGDGTIRTAMQDKSDSTRITRNVQRQDPMDPNSQPISDYEVVWVHRHIHRKDGEDYTFYTLADQVMLTDPVPLKEVVHHGKRPYVVGCCILETHKPMPAGVAELVKPLQEEGNDISNTRRDNVRFVLNKKWLVKRGKNVDLPSLVRNVPGSITLADNPEEDIKEVNWPDVTASSFQEAQYLDADLADLVGDFSPAHAQLNRRGQEPAKLAQLMSQSASPMVMYLLGTYVVTFVEPLLRQIVMLEQEYETDQVVLAIAAQRAQLLQRFNMDQVTDDLLRQELTIRVNIGMGAADPIQKVQRFLMGAKEFVEMAPAAAQLGMDTTELWKEIGGHLGYRDPMRFFGGNDPEKAGLKKKLQHAGQVIQELGKRVQDKDKELQTKKEIAHEGNVTKLVVEDLRQEHENRRALASHVVAIDQAAHGRDESGRDREFQANEGKANRDAAAQKQSQKKAASK